MSEIKVRLVEVLVKPVFMLDDGESLTPFDQEAVKLSAADWPTYATERFPAEVAEWERQLNAEK